MRIKVAHLKSNPKAKVFGLDFGKGYHTLTGS